MTCGPVMGAAEAAPWAASGATPDADAPAAGAAGADAAVDESVTDEADVDEAAAGAVTEAGAAPAGAAALFAASTGGELKARSSANAAPTGNSRDFSVDITFLR